MKLITLFILSLFPLYSSASNHYSLAFENKELLFVLNLKCSPCDLSCINNHYQLFNKRTMSVTSGTAKPIATETGHNFRGYIMRSNDIFYTLTESDVENVWDLYVEENESRQKKRTVQKEKYQITAIFDNGTC